MDPQAASRSPEEETGSLDVSSPKTEPWTNEKHIRFLNSMEAWFVHTMLEDSRRRLLHSDSNIPDSSESTIESKLILERRKKHATSSVNSMGTRSTEINRPPDKISRSPSQPYDSSQYQVVANKIENRRIVSNDEKGLAVASIAPADAFDLYRNWEI